MALTKYKLGELIRLEEERNHEGKYTLDDVRGISIQKVFIETKADMQGVSLNPYILVKPDSFVYVTVTSRNGEKITIAHNDTENTFLVSSSYVVFSISRTDVLNSDYLFMYFNRSEFDRYSRFNSWGSARETFDWNTMCDMEIELPDLATQQKYVDVYKAMVKNQQNYERGLEDLKLVCDGYIENLKKNAPCKKIGPYLMESDIRNTQGLNIESVRGLSTNKEMIPTKADMNGVGLNSYKVVEPNQIAYVPDTSRRGDKVALGFNDSDKQVLVSSIYVVFGTNEEYLLPEYLMMFYTRTEFDRYARFNSWGSARETFDWSEMCDVTIPLPDIEIQRSIVDIYNTYINRKKINEKLKLQMKEICPILIRGSLANGG